MAIDIEAPGADEADLKAALANLVGGAVVDSGDVAAEANSFDIALPAGYASFKLRLTGIAIDGASPMSLCFALSADGGSTFHNNTDDFDSYKFVSIGLDGGPAISFQTQIDALGEFGFYSVEPGEVFHVEADIYPGSVGTNAYIHSRATHTNRQDAAGFPMLNWVATRLMAATGRQNLIRVLPYGSGEANPPSSSFEFSAGSYHLVGFAK